MRFLIPAILPGLVGIALSAQAARGPARVAETYTYKTVGGLAIKADVQRLGAELGKRPVFIWIHGGSLIDGGRQNIASGPTSMMVGLFLEYGFAVVSIDYRLAPESKLPDAVADVEDAIRWIRRDGPGLFGADPNRIVVAGTSSGGYLAQVAGSRIEPRVQALIVDSGYNDLTQEWAQRGENRPKTGPGRYDHLSLKERWRKVSGSPVANALERPDGNDDFNGFVRENGTWPQTVTGWNPFTESAKFFPYLPVRHISADFPPTFLVHGLIDTDIPHQQAESMAAELEAHGIVHRLVIVPNAGHGLKGGDPLQVAHAMLDAVAFARQCLDASVSISPAPAR